MARPDPLVVARLRQLTGLAPDSARPLWNAEARVRRPADAAMLATAGPAVSAAAPGPALVWAPPPRVGAYIAAAVSRAAAAIGPRLRASGRTDRARRYAPVAPAVPAGRPHGAARGGGRGGG